MKGVILAAGFGRRLQPLTDHLPKPLLPVGGRPMIYYTLLLLKKYGITDVFINLHHHGDKIINEIGNGARLGMRIAYSEEPEIMGTGGGIKRLAPVLGGGGAFIVINSDILIDLNIDRLVAFHQKKKGAATLVLRQAADLPACRAVAVDSKDQIRDIRGKREWRGTPSRRLTFTGVHVIEPRVLDYIPYGRSHCIIETYLEMLRYREKLFGYLTRGYWSDLGQIDRYRTADRELQEGTLKLSHIRKGRAVSASSAK